MTPSSQPLCGPSDPPVCVCGHGQEDHCWHYGPRTEPPLCPSYCWYLPQSGPICPCLKFERREEASLVA